ncbi:MAG: Ig-like domain-containing protein [bacterium]
MIKRLALIIITLISVAILGGQSQASVSIPVSSSTNPAAYRLYTVDNDPTSFKIKTYDTQTSSLINTTAALNGLSKGGLLVNAAGDHLYVAIADGANSKIRAYELNASGDLTATYVDYALPPINGADCIPSGMALRGNYLYVADLNSQNIHVINLSSTAITHINTAALDMYDIAVSTHLWTSTTFPQKTYTVTDLYITQGGSAGKIIVYSSVPQVLPTQWAKVGEISGLPYPRFIKAVNKDLYISVKDKATKRHIIKYDITNIMPSRKGSVGASTFVDDWIAFDLNNDGSSLYYTWPQGNGTTKVYGVPTSQLDNGDKDIATVNSAEFNPTAQFDSLNVDPRGNYLWAAYSADGSAQKIPLTSPAASFTSIEVSGHFSYWQAGDQNAGLLLDSTYPISWRSTGPVGNVDLVYQTSDGTWGNIAPNLANTGSGTYNWTVSGIAPGTKLNVYVRASSAPLINKGWIVTYTVGSPITVTAPNGGQTFHAGDPVTINWNPAELTAFSKVKVLYTNSYSDGTQNWTETLPFANPYVYRDNSGTATWTIPAGAVAGSNYRIMVALGTTISGQYVGGINAGNFTVAPAVQMGDFNLLYPQNNTQTGTRPTFSWEASSNAVTYELHISNEVKEIAVIKNIAGTTYQLLPSDVTLERNKDYYWHVVAVNGGTKKPSTGEAWKFTTSAVDVAGSPVIYWTSPAHEARNVPRDQDVVITFNEPIDQATFNYAIQLGTNPGGWTYLWSPDSKTVTLRHSNPFAFEGYRFFVSSAKDTAGNDLAASDKADNPWRFTTRNSTDPNQAPNDFNLLLPDTNATVAAKPTFSWERATDPDDNTADLTYKLEITTLNDTAFANPVQTANTSLTSRTLVTALTDGQSYLWRVTAQDPWSGARVSTPASRPFTVNAAQVDTTGPNTTITAPANNAAVQGNVNITATISDVATGNSNVTAAEYFIDAQGPNETGFPMTGSFSSPTENVSAVWNAALASDGPHTIFVHGRDAAGNWGLAVSITVTTSGGQIASVTSVNIVRDADTVGSSVTVSWQTNAPAVDIYTASTFTTDPTAWTVAPGFGNISDLFKTDATQVGQGTAKYYKVVPAGHTLTSDDLKTDVVGKFDLHVTEGSNLIALPFIPTAATEINSVIGNQLTGGTPGTADKMYYYDSSVPEWKQAFLKADTTWSGTLTNIEPDKGYFITISAGNPAKDVTVVGTVFNGNSRTINLYKDSNMIGSVFPTAVDVNVSSLNSTLTGGLPGTADKVVYWDNAGQEFKQSFLRADNTTFQGTLSQFEPGKGYYVNNQTLINDPNPEVWNYTRP